jgi:hypothetical protein
MERPMTQGADFREYHRREAARLRTLAESATTGQMKARLKEAEKHERLAQLNNGDAQEKA